MTLTGGCSIGEWGSIMRMARRATGLAFSRAKADPRYRDAEGKPAFKDPMFAAVLLYTDDPTTGLILARNADLAEVCGVTQVEDVVVVSGERFPEEATEADRPSSDHPRIAAMVFHAIGTRCPRCRKTYETVNADLLCGRCERATNEMV